MSRRRLPVAGVWHPLLYSSSMPRQLRILTFAPTRTHPVARL